MCSCPAAGTTRPDSPYGFRNMRGCPQPAQIARSQKPTDSEAIASHLGTVPRILQSRRPRAPAPSGSGLPQGSPEVSGPSGLARPALRWARSGRRRGPLGPQPRAAAAALRSAGGAGSAALLSAAESRVASALSASPHRGGG
ncbi:unnamed protein product [Rangifer tarandus platyrhynchus]|uniref:Uncharacterized protein n=2 Tax=Rangifer tarandus platyrhynchus TaxID=3082113 RepID=A0ACB0FKU5_RANTA|nr:unnamed protein product [Rangifer tarandus platyrhynchus]CAI9712626.1 unnamed protein product [Rangifer tarandus platyrhynchus]